MAFTIRSPSFAHGEGIPEPYTCQGTNVSPPLVWDDPPAGAKSFALICDDPDAPAGTWVHWVLYSIPPEARKLPEGVPTAPKLKDGSLHGKNDFNRVGYGGPCPPPGKTHRYFFRLYAVDGRPAQVPGLTKFSCLKALEGHILGTAEYMGTFARA
jgi:hypothetical protein